MILIMTTVIRGSYSMLVVNGWLGELTDYRQVMPVGVT